MFYYIIIFCYKLFKKKNLNLTSDQIRCTGATAYTMIHPVKNYKISLHLRTITNILIIVDFIIFVVSKDE